MKTAGIVAEYNPFHLGHAYLVRRAREAGADAVVAVMSGGAVQRGSFPLFPASVRTRAALACGVDLVVELPAPYALCSAEKFAASAVSLLAALGCVDALCFGCETPDAALLKNAAQLLTSQDLPPLLKAELEGGVPFPAARQAALERLSPGSGAAVQGPGNLLGVEYCKAIQLYAPDMEIWPVLRAGAAHDAAEAEKGFSSASALREALRQGRLAFFLEHVPRPTRALYQKAMADGAYFLPGRGFDIALLSALRRLSSGEMERIPGSEEGLGNAVLNAARRAVSAEELYALAKSKRYTHSRVRRLCLCAALGYDRSLPALPPYIHLLGASERGLALLKKASPALPMSHSLRRLEQVGGPCSLVAQKSAEAADLCALLRKTPGPAGADFSAPFLRPEEPAPAAD